MNAAKMTLTATVVAAVFGLALSFGATSAEAHCRAKHLDNDGNCIPHNVGQKSETFTVELIGGSLVTDGCEGSSRRKQVTDATFPPSTVSGCEELTLEGTSDSFHLCAANINRPDRLDMNVTFFFTTGVGVEGGNLCPQDVYQGEFLAQFDEDICFGEEEGATCVTIDQSDLNLEKLQQPDKGMSAGVNFSVGTIVWTPVE